jgi:hypothetical protein
MLSLIQQMFLLLFVYDIHGNLAMTSDKKPQII